MTVVVFIILWAFFSLGVIKWILRHILSPFLLCSLCVWSCNQINFAFIATFFSSFSFPPWCMFNSFTMTFLSYLTACGLRGPTLFLTTTLRGRLGVVEESVHVPKSSGNLSWIISSPTLSCTLITRSSFGVLIHPTQPSFPPPNPPPPTLWSSTLDRKFDLLP